MVTNGFQQYVNSLLMRYATIGFGLDIKFILACGESFDGHVWFAGNVRCLISFISGFAFKSDGFSFNTIRILPLVIYKLILGQNN
jgi:hypothetical protein